ncbi:MAG: SCO1664 family protein [Acidimicrobiaceae bacterium]|nr:SCO1664 family protein [Acidimicrobiaceae bacterium]
MSVSAHAAGARDQSPIRDRPPIATDRALTLLAEGDVELMGRMPYSSNATFLVDVAHDGLDAQAIYKPVRGERPLWDFPSGLAHREEGAFLVDRALGWDLVPPTVVRDDLPFDAGSLQLFMPSNFEEHYFTLVSEDRFGQELRRICAFDIVINNTDRKSGHCLLGTDGTIWAIDNGLSFHCQFKLRTVIWDFAGERLPDGVRRDLRGLLEAGLPGSLAAALTPQEQDATLERTQNLLAAGRFPSDGHGHRWPWPLV